uniref:Uncharacterized protein n=1 Tax=Siphoviridae sp. cttDR14 TaxID=2826490 RepID=A0A8S5M223_9CAUD|nr:MAG TPA: hypothetical protein [Siphoviridae sp. cttDR14]
MNKEQQIKEMLLDVPQKIVAYDGNPAGQHLYGEQRQEIAEALYNAGYRNPPEDSVVLSREEHEILVKTAQGKIGNMKATDFLKACISSGVMVEAVSTKEQVKQAVKEFASKLKDEAVDFLYSATVDGHPGFDIHISELCHMIDELLKEFLK